MEKWYRKLDVIRAVNVGAISAAALYGRTDSGIATFKEILKAVENLPSADPEAAIVKVLKMVEEYKEKTGTDEILIMPKNGMAAWDENGVKYTMQPERKTGKWILMSDSDGKYYVCSVCGNELQRYSTEPPTWEKPYPHKQSIDKTDFCPNCGCKMEG